MTSGNIGIVTTWFERGAAYVSRAYRETLSEEYDVYIYARGGEKFARGDPNWDHDYVTWGTQGVGHSIELGHFFDWLESKKIRKVIFNEQQDWEIILALRSQDVLLGAYVDYYQPCTIPFFELYDFLLCNTRRHYRVFQWHPGSIYIPWGTDCGLFSPRTKRSMNGKINFFHSAGTGGVNCRKGTDLLIRAFEQVSGAKRLIVHSQVPVSRYGKDIEEIVERNPSIEFIHKEVSAPGLYYKGDVFVYPSRLEGIGLTVPEALASGLPVITTDSAPMNEFVKDYCNGRLIPVENRRLRSDKYYWPETLPSIGALAAAMQFFMDNSSELCQWKHRARLYALENLDWSKNSAQLLPFLRQLTRNKARTEIAARLEGPIQTYQKSIWPHNSKRYKIRRILKKLSGSMCNFCWP